LVVKNKEQIILQIFLKLKNNISKYLDLFSNFFNIFLENATFLVFDTQTLKYKLIIFSDNQTKADLFETGKGNVLENTLAYVWF